MGRSGLQTGCDSSAPPVHFVCCQHSQPRAKGHVRRWSITPCCLLCPHWHNAAVPALPTCLSVSPQVMLGAVCARTMRMRLQLGVPVLGTLCFVHGNITVQKTLQNITVGQKSCDMAGGTCRPCHLQAQQNALRSICLHSEPHPPLLPQSKGGRCQHITAGEPENRTQGSHIFPLPAVTGKTSTTKVCIHFSPHFHRHCTKSASH